MDIDNIEQLKTSFVGDIEFINTLPYTIDIYDPLDLGDEEGVDVVYTDDEDSIAQPVYSFEPSGFRVKIKAKETLETDMMSRLDPKYFKGRCNSITLAEGAYLPCTRDNTIWIVDEDIYDFIREIGYPTEDLARPRGPVNEYDGLFGDIIGFKHLIIG